MPATCGKCHVGIKQHYDESIHGTALAAGNAKAPVCADCHTAHSIQRVETDAWRLSITNECGTCHAESLRTYRDTFHGQVTSLGFVRVAACADCHGSHDIQKRTDPRSRVSQAHLVETCRQCHAGANANFVRYDPHADKHDRARNPVLYYAAKFMDFLLIARVRLLRPPHRAVAAARPAGAPPGAAAPGRERAGALTMLVEMPGTKLYRRFDAFDRVLHIGLMTSFLGLAITGLPLFFSTSAWASRIAHALGGFHAAGILHRSAATLLMTVFAVHVGRILKRLFRDQDLGMLWGPRSMVPQPRDVVDLFKHVQWFLGKGERPRFDQLHLLGEVRLLGGLLGDGDHRRSRG